jgi:hypothetical protein
VSVETRDQSARAGSSAYEVAPSHRRS